MGEQVMDLNEGSFDAAIGQGVILVDFWAPWCGPCRIQGPIVEAVAAKVAGKARVAKLNVDEAQGAAVRFGIRSIPTLIIFKDGKVVKQFVGVQSEQNLVSAISAAG